MGKQLTRAPSLHQNALNRPRQGTRSLVISAMTMWQLEKHDFLTDVSLKNQYLGCFTTDFVLNGFFEAVFPRFSSLKTYYGSDRPLFEKGQALDVVGHDHHGHREACAYLADGPNRLTAHLFYGCKYVFYPRPYFGDVVVTPLLAFGEGMVSAPFALDTPPITLGLELFFTLLTGVASVSIHFRAGIPVIQNRNKVLAVMDAGRIRHQFPDEFVFAVHTDRELEAMAAFPMLLRLGRLQIFLATFRRTPVSGHGLFLDLFFVFPGKMLLGSRNQGGINDLTPSRQITVL